ncbi:MAG: tetratricopeptide repeat protein [Oscillatoriales cyanobacterium RM1_1_9]|nr:tetratricopeptide repeat protein [Oscillatoriales cyanobacterium SM2_3_0]NJO44923.1 tetratricopeptide repeat protein [Oscillatoriales cyanobacterium RM2_1_1]NJO70764.1 tetratricopeptide repeat protein [Oscillatoriales cyanobacterium RM1_1_9]
MTTPDMTSLQQRAEDYLAQGRAKEAIALLTQVLTSHPQIAHGHFKLGEAFLAEQEFSQAVAAYETAIQLNANAFIYYVGLGRAWAGLEQWPQAISAYEWAIRLNPNFSWTYTHLAAALLGQERYPEAIAAYDRDIALNPQFYWSHFHRGEALLKLENREAAIASYRQAIILNPDLPEAQQRLQELLTTPELNGDYWLQRQDWDQAIKAYKSSLEIKPDYSWSYYGLGYGLQQKQDWSGAILAYLQALEINPDFSGSYSNLGYCYWQQGEVIQAINCYEQALALNADVPEIHNRLADALLVNCQVDRAIDHYLTALQLYPENSENYLKLRHLQTYNLVQLQPEQMARLITGYQQLIQDDPTRIDSYINLGDLWTEAGNISAAIDCYQRGTDQNLQQSRPALIQQFWNPETPLKPAFLIIGTQKSGTTSLYQYICQHPQVVAPLQKEIDFFIWQFHHGLDWYLAHFPAISAEAALITGEASPSYILDFKVAEKLKENFPGIKLIVLLRNPVNRAFSQYQDHKRWVNPESRSLEQAIADEIALLQDFKDVTLAGEKFWQTQYGYLLRGMYVYFLEKWMSILPREQFLILQSEAFYAEPEPTLNRVFDFLNLPNYSLPTHPKYTTGSYLPIPQPLRQTLVDFFAPHNQRLIQFLGEEFDWRS